MDFRGWVRTSLIEYPSHIATVLFAAGCNFRCPMCHNSELVVDFQSLPAVPVDDVKALLTRREGLVDGVVITGGEPTLQPDLLPFLEDVRSLGMDVKVDTNGSRPDVLQTLLARGLVDYVAMDVKAPVEKYGLLTGMAGLDVQPIEESVTLLQGSGVEVEFRTTIVPGLLDRDDVAAIARWLAGARQYILQQFRPLSTLNHSLERVVPYPPEVLREMAEQCRQWVPTKVRGV